MITTARPLPIKEIIFSKTSHNSKSIWCGDKQEEILTHKSWVSMYLIFQWFNEKNGRKPVVYVPSFYCYDTLVQVEMMAEFIGYDITDDYLPDYKHCAALEKEKKPDIFIFVHFFGMELNVNDTKNYCKNRQIILIEDAVHLLIGQRNAGKFGDFVLYSPWKHIGLPDGAVLVLNSKGPTGLLVEEVCSELTELNVGEVFSVNKWKVKKIFGKILPNRNNALNLEEQNIYKKENACLISTYSKNKLLNIAEKDVLLLRDKKRINSLVLQDCLWKKFGFSSNLKAVQPYAYTLEAYDDYEDIWEYVNKLGQVAFMWPGLKPNCKELEKTKKLKRHLMHIAVHDGMNPEYIHKKLYIKHKEKDDLRFQLCNIDEETYDMLCESIKDPLPLVQSSIYANAKRNTKGWEIRYWLIKKDDIGVAFFLTLTKYGFVHRINRGPYLLADNHQSKIYNLIIKEFGKGLNILFWAPEVEQSGCNINQLLSMGCKYRECYFSTGYIDLELDEVDIRANLNSKWRNQLKASEKLDLMIYRARKNEEFNVLLNIHKKDKCDRNYVDSGDDITENLFASGNMICLYVKNDDDEIISLVMIATHYKTATYYVGWSSKEGYQKNANRLLLWEAMLELKKSGYKWFDLGGIDLINTKSIADFKIGTGCKYWALVGEFYSCG